MDRDIAIDYCKFGRGSQHTHVEFFTQKTVKCSLETRAGGMHGGMGDGSREGVFPGRFRFDVCYIIHNCLDILLNLLRKWSVF